MKKIANFLLETSLSSFSHFTYLSSLYVGCLVSEWNFFASLGCLASSTSISTHSLLMTAETYKKKNLNSATHRTRPLSSLISCLRVIFERCFSLFFVSSQLRGFTREHRTSVRIKFSYFFFLRLFKAVRLERESRVQSTSFHCQNLIILLFFHSTARTYWVLIGSMKTWSTTHSSSRVIFLSVLLLPIPFHLRTTSSDLLSSRKLILYGV